MVCVCLYLLQFEGDHGKSTEHAVRRTRDGDDPLWTGTLGDVDPGAALWGRVEMARRGEGSQEGMMGKFIVLGPVGTTGQRTGR